MQPTCRVNLRSAQNKSEGEPTSGRSTNYGSAHGDQVEQEIGSDASDAAMLGVAHCTVLFAPAEDAFGHRPARLRDAVALAPPSSSPLPSLGRKLFCEAQASISVPSTEKCSSDNSGLTCGWFKSLVMNLANTSPLVQSPPDWRGAPRQA